MKKTVEIGISLAVILVATVTISALMDPYGFGGYVRFQNETGCVGANVTFTNERTGEQIYFIAVANGAYAQCALNFPSEYEDGDEIGYYTLYDGYTNTTSIVIDVEDGGTTRNIYLEEGGASIRDPYPMNGLVKFDNGTVVGGANVTFTNQRTGEMVYSLSKSDGYYIQDAANTPSGYIDGDVISYYTSYDGYENTTSHTINISEGSRTMDITLHPAMFDTGEGTYPSISGVHSGTIKLNQTITISKLYTYPCKGTGGHTEFIELYENDILIVNGTWNGYKSHWHTITLHKVSGASYVTLLKNHTYNYTIRTGSYPQIHHTDNLSTPAGFITCSEFVDANGKVYTDWIPAIKLFDE